MNLNDATVTLRDAIHAAEHDVAVSPTGPAGLGADTITFDSALFAGGSQTIHLTTVGDTGDLPLTHEGEYLGAGAAGNSAFRITTSITIQGPTGANGLTLSAPGDTGDASTRMRLFLVDTTGNLTIERLKLTGGYALPSVPTSGDTGFDGGGAIQNLGTLTLRNSIVTGNTCGAQLFAGGGGGISNMGGNPSGIFETVGVLAVIDSTITNNSLMVTLTFPGEVEGESEDVEVMAGFGGGIWNSLGTVAVAGSEITNNSALAGGGIYNTGRLNLSETVISGNSAGGNFPFGDFAIEMGGGIFNKGQLVVANSSITGNTAQENGGGIYSTGSLTLTGSTISDNSAQNGGGIFIPGGFSISFNFSELFDQLLEQAGLSDVLSQFEGFDAFSELFNFFDGSGLRDFSAIPGFPEVPEEVLDAIEEVTFFPDFPAGIAIVYDSTINGNSASNDGGGIYNAGQLTLTNSTLSGNSAGRNGGGLAATSTDMVLISTDGSTTVIGCTIDHNSAGGDGGGIASEFISVPILPIVFPTAMVIANSTISGNSADGSGGGFASSRLLGRAVVTNSTVVLNRADADGNGTGTGGGISDTLAPTSGSNEIMGAGYFVDPDSIADDVERLTVDVFDSIVLGNRVGTGSSALPLDVFSAFPLDDSNNLIGVSLADSLQTLSLLSVSDVIDLELQDNGGPTKSHALVAGSAAIDAGSGTIDALANPLTADQRGTGFSRVTGAAVDIGAYENQAPTDIALNPASVAENEPADTVVGTLSTTDPDLNDTFSYSLVSGDGDTDNASFTIDASGNLRTTASFDFETRDSYSIRVRSTDANGLFTEKAFTIHVADVNEAPATVTLSESIVAENPPAGTIIGTLSATDPDADTLTFSLVAGVGDTDNALFQIVGDKLETTGPLDFETQSSYSVRVRVTDANGLSHEEVFTITATDVNEEPTSLALSGNTVAENKVAGTGVGTLSATDPDAADTLTFSLVAGAGDTDNALFQVVGNELRTAAVLDFEAKSSYSVRVRVTDAGGLSHEEVFTIAVTDTADVLGFDVQKGAVQRSYIRYLTLTLSDRATAQALAASGRLKMMKADLNGLNAVEVALGNVTVKGRTLTIDYAPRGFSRPGNPNVRDGYYTLLIDIDGDTIYETSQSFYRLLGDTDGDGRVSRKDLNAIRLALATGAYNANLDLDGNGFVDAGDLTVARNRLGRAIAPTLHLDD